MLAKSLFHVELDPWVRSERAWQEENGFEESCESNTTKRDKRDMVRLEFIQVDIQ